MPEVLPQEFAFQHPASPGGDWPALVGTPDDEPSLSRGGGGATGGESWPVGAIFLSLSATSPATLLGYGTWTPIGAGQVLLGHDGASYIAGNTGGQEYSLITHAGGTPSSHPFIAQHLHGFFVTSAPFSHSQVNSRQGTSAGNVLTTPTQHDHNVSGNTGYDSGVSLPDHDPIDNRQPFLVVYMWYRLA